MKLFITVGTNPLPVYVAVKQLFGYFQTIDTPLTELYFIVSNQTVEYLPPLRDLLKETFPDINGLVNDSVAVHTGDGGNPAIIHDEIKKHLIKDDRCHLHYTGGTKALAVHAWESIRTSDISSTSSSYLDARGGNKGPFVITNSGQTIVSDCREGIDLDISQLLSLHDYVLKEEPKKPPEVWSSTLFKLLCQKKNWKEYNTFFEKTWTPMLTSIHKNLPDQIDLSECDSQCSSYVKIVENWQHKARGCVAPDIDCWNNFCSQFNSWLSENKYQTKFNAQGSFIVHDEKGEKIEKVIKKIEKEIFGKFIEYALYYAVNSVLEKKGKEFKIYNSIEIVPKNKPQPKEFELDVVVLLGYQLIVFSCTTKDKESEIKLKAMEAMHRAEQIGGGEARAVVVCGSACAAAKKVKEELYQDCGRGTDVGLIDVWGWEHWNKLENKLENYFSDTLKW